MQALKLRADLPEVNDRMGQMAELDNNLPEAKQYEAASSSATATVPMRMRLARAYLRRRRLPRRALPWKRF
jgi:hypothetical protein